MERYLGFLPLIITYDHLGFEVIIPEQYGKPLRGPLSGLWELYFENSFRILYSVDQGNERVVIREIRHKDDF